MPSSCRELNILTGHLLSIPNIRYFVTLRVLFNARFYYPIFTILFLDFGLTIEQFALLNSVWAATIVLAEVPSGALADLLGRKRLLLLTSLFMIVEMLLLSFVPLGNISLIFWVFLLNRVFSGLAEAMASGADEALAYDTLVELQRQQEWPRVLEIQMRAKSLGFVIAMTVGALVYDPETINKFLFLVGSSIKVTQQMSMRYPIYLTLLLSMFACITTVKMREPALEGEKRQKASLWEEIWDATRLIYESARWIVKTGFALSVILFAMSYDHVLRMIVTMTSEYYRLISLPEASFGVIGSMLALLGFVVPTVAQVMVIRYTPTQNMFWLSGITLIALTGLSGFYPYLFGLLPMVLLTIGMMLTSFFTSHYLNRQATSRLRATILSFKGLALNLAYGCIGVFYAGLMVHLRKQQQAHYPNLSEAIVENQAFMASISWIFWYTAALLIIVLLFCRSRLKTTEDHHQVG